MSAGFLIKTILSLLTDVTGLSKMALRQLNRKYKNNYIRILNYHSVPPESREQFAAQIKWFSEYFEICNKSRLYRFLSGQYTFSEKPGVIFTFDDGFLDNYTVAFPILREYGAVGMFMVSPDLIGKKNAGTQNMDYMNAEQIRELFEYGNEICSHTSSHHRMNQSDSTELLSYEIVRSKTLLEELLHHEVDGFCWCGGEEDTYTAPAAEMIRHYYRFGFMTNSLPIFPDTDWFQLDRSNIEASWSMSLVRFQIAGFIDWKLKEKRARIHQLTK